jgi:transcriptional regulator GlxA family with amidase domain
MNVAVVTFDGFNEIDSLVALHIINRVALPGWRAEIAAPGPHVTSMNGVVLAGQRPLESVADADAVIVGSGRRTREFVANDEVMSRLRIDPERQYVASQCSGALVLIKLGLVGAMSVCTDVKTAPDVEAAGFHVLDSPFVAHGRVATAGGCLSAQYLATWLIWSGAGRETAVDALSYVLPRGEEQQYLSRALGAVARFVVGPAVAAGQPSA